MDRGFFPRRPRFPRRCHDQWFYQNYMPNENYWMDAWDMPQNQFPEGAPPWWNQHHPEQEGPYNVDFDNYTQSSYPRRPYRGHPYRRFKKTSSKGRGNFQNPSSSRLNNVQPKKTFAKVKKQAEDSKKFKQDKENTATSVKKDVPSKVKPKDSQPDEESPRQTDSVASPEAVAEEESPSGIKKNNPHTQNEDIVLDKLKDCDATEDLLSQIVSILSPGVSTEDKTSCNTDVLQNIEEKDSVLTETSAKQNDTDHCQACVAPALDSSSLPSSPIDVHCKPVLVTEKDNELIETSAKQTDIDDSQAYAVAPALDSSSLPSTPIDVHCEPVLVRGNDIGLIETSAKQTDTDVSLAYVVAPVLESFSLPSTHNDTHCEPVLVREKDNGLTETATKQNDTGDSQTYAVAPALESFNLPSTPIDVHCEPVVVTEKDNELTETSAKQTDTGDSQAYAVAPALDSSSLPSTPIDVHCGLVLVIEKDNELTETSTKENDTDDSQANVVTPALDSSSLPSTLKDIRSVPVLMRRKVIGLAENHRAWAPEDYQEPPWNMNQTDQYLKVSERYKDSVSTSISSNEKHNIESLAKSKSSSPKIHHSINSKHSSTNKTSRDLRCQSPRSCARQERSSRSSGKRDPSTERQDRSSKLSYRREHSSGSSHKQEDSPQRDKHRSKSPYRQEQSSQKRGCSPKTSLVQEHGVKSVRKRKHSSNSPPKKKQKSKSQKLDRNKKCLWHAIPPFSQEVYCGKRIWFYSADHAR
ncbi:uncharacterized protein LOC116509111 isoform X2 [Thamnophis elegans]|uniref:uncharacterized protein LOC116509111 isoform X2 n=1 Tax=Thamnophis elegans TaxID=35005 RepID=UPI0013769660|nr:uncharacterized protein LOC116509111 isoform X2 [Thamnophis elegans]